MLDGKEYVEYTDSNGEVKLIPLLFKQVLDEAALEATTPGGLKRVESFLDRLKELVAWNEQRKITDPAEHTTFLEWRSAQGFPDG